MGAWGQRLSREEVELLASLIGEPWDELASVCGSQDGAHFDVTLVARGRRVDLGWADEVLPDALLDESIRLTVGSRGNAAVTWASPLPAPWGPMRLCQLGRIVAVEIVVAEEARRDHDPPLTGEERERQLRTPPIDVGVRIETDRGRCICVCTGIDAGFVEVTTDGTLPRPVAGVVTLEPIEERLRAIRSGDGPRPGDLP